MRSLLLAVSLTALLTTTACGTAKPAAEATTSPTPADRRAGMDGMDMSTPTPTPTTAPTAAPTPAPSPNAAAVLDSVKKDASDYAIRLEQVFAGSSYPKDLAGAVAAAKKLGLSLSPGNSFGSYVYDPNDVEFKLCVQNTSGAFATYDTRPMTLLRGGTSGGCPR